MPKPHFLPDLFFISLKHFYTGILLNKFMIFSVIIKYHFLFLRQEQFLRFKISG